MNEKSLIPSIRFAGFTDAWERRKVEKLAIRVSSIGEQIGRPRVEYEDIISGIGQLNKDIFSKVSNKPGIEFADGDVLYGKLRPYLKNWLLPNFNGLAVGDFWVLRPQNVDSKFLFRLIQSRKFEEVANQSAGTKMPRADWKLVSKTDFGTPLSAAEQRKLGSFFEALDSFITLHQRKYEKLLNIKKSMLDKMFPKNDELFPEVRFAGFTDAWERRKLGEIADKVTEKNSSRIYSETFTNSAENGIISQRDYFDHAVSNSANLDGYYIVSEDDFVYNPRISTTAPVGPINRNRLKSRGLMSPLYTVFRTRDIDALYLEHYFKSHHWHQYMFLNGDSGARSDRFSIKDFVFMEMPIAVPCKVEQMRIGSFLEELDHLITLHQRKLEKLQNIKKACLEKMFV
ncbi:restriction endonuclease subunit S [Akkermansia sp.]|uniref:restriction endonuclease subunit S n=1 Tax=Akkermansia sp. TaxID=1872421 RepID=UPI0025C1528F|nr:restriction endonuclease subunit S [Akkermansia sp.]MCD8272255.1 restriction endonuclease subunit S [Akkermansia sp.]